MYHILISGVKIQRLFNDCAYSRAALTSSKYGMLKVKLIVG